MLTAIFKLHRGFSVKRQTPERSGGWAGGRGPYLLVHICCFYYLFDFLLGVYRPWEVSPRFTHEMSHRMHSKSCLTSPWDPRYEHICENIYLGRDGSGL